MMDRRFRTKPDLTTSFGQASCEFSFKPVRRTYEVLVKTTRGNCVSRFTDRLPAITLETQQLILL